MLANRNLFLLPLITSLLALASSARAQPPTLQQLQDLQLHDGFTLTYTVHRRDVRTPVMRDAERQGIINGYQYGVAHGQMKQADADRMIAGLSRMAEAEPEQSFAVTLSAHDGRMLFIRQQLSQPISESVILYDGRMTYSFSSADAVLHVEPGFQTEHFSDCLIPGVGLPALPLARPTSSGDAAKVSLLPADLMQQPGDVGRRCAVAALNVANFDANLDNVYLPGEIYAQRSGRRLRVTKIIVGAADRPEYEWDYDQPQTFQGMWLARHAHWVEYRIYENGKPVSPAPVHVADYRITLAQPAPLAASKFDIKTYLSPNATVEYGEAANGLRFQYDPKDGDLETQRQAAILRQAGSQKQTDQIVARMDDDPTFRGDGRDAGTILRDAETEAKSQNKNIFLVFHASWCEPCFLLHRFLNDPTVKPLLDAHYVVLDLDVFERGDKKDTENPGGVALMTKYGGTDLIPFYAVLNASGDKPFTGAQGVGVPSSATATDTFIGLIKKTASGVTDTDLNSVRTALKRDTTLEIAP